MTTNNPKQPTVQATEVGKNCGACNNMHTYLQEHEDSRYRIINTCVLSPVSWYHDRTPIRGADHPPGRSVCDDFEAMG